MTDKTNILVIDEDLMVRQTLSYALEEEGFQAVPAANRQEAVSQFGSRRIHVLLMDAHPQRENAQETLDCLIALQPNLQVIAMTSQSERQVPDRIPSRYNALFEKPLDFPGLVATIRGLSSEPPSLSAHAHPSCSNGQWNAISLL